MKNDLQDNLYDIAYNQVGASGPDFYPSLDSAGKNQALGKIECAMTDWLARAEQDLLVILGSGMPAAGRGGMSKTIHINLINTFKCRAGGVCVASKALRWVQMRLADVAAGLRCWAQECLPKLFSGF